MSEPETTLEEAIAMARRAIHDSDGRGMIGRGRNHLEERVARALIQHERRIAELETALRRAKNFIRDEGNATAHAEADYLEEILKTEKS